MIDILSLSQISVCSCHERNRSDLPNAY